MNDFFNHSFFKNWKLNVKSISKEYLIKPNLGDKQDFLLLRPLLAVFKKAFDTLSPPPPKVSSIN